MNNDALVAALGMDAVAAVHGYRLQVISEAKRHRLTLVNKALSEVVKLPAGGVFLVDPIDIRLTFLRSPHRTDLAGRMLRWGPAHGWSSLRAGTYAPISYYAGPYATPMELVPTPAEVVEWATSERGNPSAGNSTPPTGVELDDEPEVIHRLLSFIDPQGMPMYEAFSPPHQ